MGITSRMIGERGRRQATKLGIDPSRIPPGQYLTERFPVLTYGRNPKYDLKEWSLSIWGEVEEPFSLRWSKLDTTWTGVRARDLLERANVKPTGTHVMAHSDGGYTTNLPVAALYD